MRVLIVEDEPGVATFVSKALNEVGYETEVEHNGFAGYQRTREESFSLVILDLMLPDMDGFTILQCMRDRGDDTPVLILTARSDTSERIKGLDAGADDYLPKPFEVAELIARVRVLFRRGRAARLTFEDLILNRSHRTAERNGRKMYLSSMEMALLEFLMANPNRPVSKKELLDAVWNDPLASNQNVVEVYISHLRQKTELNQEPRLIQTVRGQGYMLSALEP